ncbi:hypothetical protein [Labilibaculum sp.]|uniref:hypothetical protein n=1 Tax=Labilibaculum sp. TaxID=2060723 RepID=UPI003564C6A5
MSKEQIAHPFKIDQSKSPVESKDEKGNGLDMMLCKQFMEQNKVEIHLESNSDTRSTFQFSIPATENKN